MRGLGHSGPVNCVTDMTSAVGASAKGDWIVTGGVDHNLMVSPLKGVSQEVSPNSAQKAIA